MASAGQVAATASRHDLIGLAVGYQPPQFSTTDCRGQPHTVTAYTGQVLVLHFWASWCPYCRGEIPKLTKLAQPDWQAKGVRVLAISIDEDPTVLEQFITTSNLPYPIVADRQAVWSVADQYNISGIPVTFVIGRDGDITARLRGAGDIVGAVEQALK